MNNDEIEQDFKDCPIMANVTQESQKLRWTTLIDIHVTYFCVSINTITNDSQMIYFGPTRDIRTIVHSTLAQEFRAVSKKDLY